MSIATVPAGLLFPVHERRGAPHSLHLDAGGGGSHAELPARDAAARERAIARGLGEGLAGTVPAEVREFVDLVVPTPDVASLEAREEGDLADAMRLFGRPEKDERPAGHFGAGVGGGSTGNRRIDHGEGLAP